MYELSLYLIGFLVVGFLGLYLYQKGMWNLFFDKESPTVDSIEGHVETEKQNLSKPAYTAVFLSDDADLPSLLSLRAVYIIGVKGNEWLAVLLCPCGCGSRIQLNLLQEERPCWKWRVTNSNVVTLVPSVWRKVGCKSHFVIRNGVVLWC